MNNTERFVFDNIVLKPSPSTSSSSYTLINTYSYRRCLVSEGEIVLLMSAQEKTKNSVSLDPDESALLDRLIGERQILSDQNRKEYDDRRKEYVESSLTAPNPLINSISVFLTFSCNFNCEYCYQRSFANKRQALSITDIDKIIEYLSFFNGTDDPIQDINLVAINGGEPCQKRNVHVINYILERFGNNPTCKFELYTNGSNIISLKNAIDFSKFKKIQVSLDGDEDIIKKINKAPGTYFQKTIDGIIFLSEICEEVNVECTVTRPLIDAFDTFYAKLMSTGVLETKAHFLMGPINDFCSMSGFDEKQLSVAEYVSFRNYVKSLSCGQYFTFRSIPAAGMISRILYSNDIKALKSRDSLCNPLDHRSLMFSPGGLVYWCLKAVEDSGFSIGDFNIRDSRYIDIYKKYLMRNIHTIDSCSKCKLKYICAGGCLLYSIGTSNNAFNGFCGLFNNKEFMDNLEDYIWRN